MRQRLIVLGLAALVTGIASAQNNRTYECSYAGMMRRVEVAYTTGEAVPCEVRYYKQTEGADAPQVLWSAQHETGYCEEQARQFVAKLQGLGWTCSDQGTTGSAPARPPGDDTDVLRAGPEQR
jgi:hypothetical protein